MLAAVVADVRDQQNLRETRKQVFLDDVDFELTKSAAEFDMPFI